MFLCLEMKMTAWNGNMSSSSRRKVKVSIIKWEEGRRQAWKNSSWAALLLLLLPSNITHLWVLHNTSFFFFLFFFLFLFLYFFTLNSMNPATFFIYLSRKKKRFKRTVRKKKKIEIGVLTFSLGFEFSFNFNFIIQNVTILSI